MEGLLAGLLVGARDAESSPTFAGRLEHITFELARLHDDAVDDDGRLALFDSLARTLDDVRAEAPASARTALGDVCELLVSERASFVALIADGVASPTADDAGILAASVDGPRAHRVVLTPLRVSSLSRGRYRDGTKLRLGLRPADENPPTPSPLAPLARDAMEDLASLGSLRRLAEDEAPWRAVDFEKRLLADLDYLAALGRGQDAVDLGGELSRFLAESIDADPGRVFAVALVHACMRGFTPLAGLRRLTMGVAARTEAAMIDALSLGSNAHLDDLLAQLAVEDDEAVIAVAVTASGRRRKVSPSIVGLLEHPSERVAEAAARALVHTDDPSRVAPLLLDHLAGPPRVAAACLITLAVLGAEMAFRTALDIAENAARGGVVDERLDSALAVLALSARRRAAEVIEAAARRSKAGLEWLGWLGDASHFATIGAAVAALGRDGIRTHDLDSSPAFRALARVISAVDLETVREDPVRAQEIVAALPPSRVRRGRPWSLGQIVEELEAPTTPQSVRRLLVLEASLARRRAFPFDPDGWLDKEWNGLRALGEAGTRPHV